MMKIETWKKIKGYEGLYEISNLGRVKRLYKNKKEKILKPIKDSYGYMQYSLSKDSKNKSIRIHRLVALHFIDNPNNYPEVNHIDGNKENYSIDNLEWCDKSYNTAYNKVLGINVKGEQIGTAKLTNADVLIIKECLSCGVEQNVLADKFSVNRLTIHGISTNKQWNHIIFNKLPKRSPNINYYTILEIEKLLNQGKSQNEIHKLLKVSHRTIVKVKNKVYEEYKTCYRKYILNGI